MKKAFSLAELLVTLTVIAIISAITVPIVTRQGQDLYGPLYKSAFNLAETTVNELIADQSLYTGGNLYSATASTFCNNFASKVNIAQMNSCSTSTVAGTPNFITTNGMRWYNLNATFASNVTIQVDIDGASRGDNAAGKADVNQIIITQFGKLTTPTAAGNETTYLRN